MSGMFDNFNNIDTSYIPNTFQPKHPCGFNESSPLVGKDKNKPFELKNADGSIKGYFWYKGNSISLVFKVTGEIILEDTDVYMSAAEVLDSLDLVATFYDFKHNEVISYYNQLDAKNRLEVTTNINEDTNEVEAYVTLEITKEQSNLSFPKGVYSLELVASHLTGYCQTIFSVDDCMIEVR